jgi:hypothetical protein
MRKYKEVKIKKERKKERNKERKYCVYEFAEHLNSSGLI